MKLRNKISYVLNIIKTYKLLSIDMFVDDNYEFTIVYNRKYKLIIKKWFGFSWRKNNFIQFLDIFDNLNLSVLATFPLKWLNTKTQNIGAINDTLGAVYLWCYFFDASIMQFLKYCKSLKEMCY